MKNENNTGIEKSDCENRAQIATDTQTRTQCVNRKSKIVNSFEERRPKGKVAHLPPDLRRQVNEMLDYGDTYKDIAERLNELGHPGFFYQNIQRWKEGGYKHWLRAQDKREETMI